MATENTFVKITGDLVNESESGELFIRPDAVVNLRLIQTDSFVSLVPGGGSRISEELERLGIPYKFGPLGREIESHRGRQIARDILEDRQAKIQDSLNKESIKAEVIPCFRYMGSVLCLVNGDLLVKEAYVNYPRLFIFTLEGQRFEKKKREFRKFPKVRIIGFPD